MLLTASLSYSQTRLKIYNNSSYVLEILDLHTINFGFNGNPSTFVKNYKIQHGIKILQGQTYVMENLTYPVGFPFYSPASVPNLDMWWSTTDNWLLPPTFPPTPAPTWISETGASAQASQLFKRTVQQLWVFKSRMLEDYHDDEHFNVLLGEWVLGDSDLHVDNHQHYSDGINYEVIYWKTFDSSGNPQYNFYCYDI